MDSVALIDSDASSRSNSMLRAVYALGLYVDPAAVKQKVAPKFRGQAPEALSTSQQLLDGARRLRPPVLKP